MLLRQGFGAHGSAPLRDSNQQKYLLGHCGALLFGPLSFVGKSVFRRTDPSIVSESRGGIVAEVYPISADKDIDDRCVIFLRNSFAQRHPSGKPFNKVGTLLPKNERLHSDFRVLKAL